MHYHTPVVVFDIETISAPLPEGMKEDFERKWKAPSNYKDEEKIAAKKQEDLKSFERNAKFKIYGNSIVSCAIGQVNWESDEPLINEQVFADLDERKVATFFAGYLNELQSYKLCGFNIKNFDVPQMSRALSRAQQSLEQKIGKWDLIDLYEFPCNRELSLELLCRALGLPGKIGDGSMVASYVANGQWDKLKEYNLDDVRKVALAFKELSRTWRFF